MIFKKKRETTTTISKLAINLTTSGGREEKKPAGFIVDHHKVPEKRCVGGIVNYCTHIASKKMLIYSLAEVTKKKKHSNHEKKLFNLENCLIYSYPDISEQLIIIKEKKKTYQNFLICRCWASFW